MSQNEDEGGRIGPIRSRRLVLLRLFCKAYGFRQFTPRDYRELSTWLMPLALSTDAGPALVGALIEEMRERKIMIPGITTVERLLLYSP
jgi:hypothetical protein